FQPGHQEDAPALPREREPDRPLGLDEREARQVVDVHWAEEAQPGQLSPGQFRAHAALTPPELIRAEHPRHAPRLRWAADTVPSTGSAARPAAPPGLSCAVRGGPPAIKGATPAGAKGGVHRLPIVATTSGWISARTAGGEPHVVFGIRACRHHRRRALAVEWDQGRPRIPAPGRVPARAQL